MLACCSIPWRFRALKTWIYWKKWGIDGWLNVRILSEGQITLIYFERPLFKINSRNPMRPLEMQLPKPHGTRQWSRYRMLIWVLRHFCTANGHFLVENMAQSQFRLPSVCVESTTALVSKRDWQRIPEIPHCMLTVPQMVQLSGQRVVWPIAQIHVNSFTQLHFIILIRT